jgi:hypothetical protein
MELKEVALSCVVALIVGVTFAALTFFALYSTMGYYGLGIAIVFGFPSGIIHSAIGSRGGRTRMRPHEC